MNSQEPSNESTTSHASENQPPSGSSEETPGECMHRSVSLLDSPIVVEFSNEHPDKFVEGGILCKAVQKIVAEADYDFAEISIAVVDDPTIHELNRQYLEHDYATDCLSFVLEASDEHLVGEIVLSADTAERNAAEYKQSAADEILLYAIHGALHLVGLDDTSPKLASKMREAEQAHLNYWVNKVPHSIPDTRTGDSNP
jgi:probable rRNA maturation factor